MQEKTYFCTVSNKPIPQERVEALTMLGIPEHRWTCVEHSLDKPRQGIFMGEAGTSELLFVDKVYDNSVRAVFKGASVEEEEPEKPSNFYSNKEMQYYTQSEETADS
jgi:hypothetical protein